jgi:hypothetical protein
VSDGEEAEVMRSMDMSIALAHSVATIKLRKGAREKNHNVLRKRGESVSGSRREMDMPHALAWRM